MLANLFSSVMDVDGWFPDQARHCPNISLQIFRNMVGNVLKVLIFLGSPKHMPSENQAVTSSENASTCFNTLHRQYILICCYVCLHSMFEMLMQIIKSQ